MSPQSIKIGARAKAISRLRGRSLKQRGLQPDRDPPIRFQDPSAPAHEGPPRAFGSGQGGSLAVAELSAQKSLRLVQRLIIFAHAETLRRNHDSEFLLQSAAGAGNGRALPLDAPMVGCEQIREFEAATSYLLIEELEKGDHPQKAEKLALMKPLPLFAVTPEVIEIAEVYLERFVMPRSDPADAFHLALASHHQCDILLTWNCNHLANYRKFDHIRRINTLLGLSTPALLTPLELLGESESP